MTVVHYWLRKIDALNVVYIQLMCINTHTRVYPTLKFLEKVQLSFPHNRLVPMLATSGVSGPVSLHTKTTTP